MHDGVKDKDLTREQIIARNLRVVDAHFHNETPESVDKAIALYDDDIVWEAPMRGVVLTDPVEIVRQIEAAREAGYTAALALGGGQFPPARVNRWAVPRENIPAGLSENGFVIRSSGL